MKKYLLLILSILIFGSGYAQKWNEMGSKNPTAPKVKLISNSEDRIVVNFTLGGFYTDNVKTPKGKQAIVSVPGMVSMLEAGAPDLPMYAISAIIGDAAEMTVNVTDAQYTDYKNMEIAPSKGNFSRQINPDDVPYRYGSMYGQNAFYPANEAYLEQPYILRDFRGQDIMVTPITYNPATKTLRVYSNITIEMKKVSNNGVNQKLSRKAENKVDAEMEHSYNRRFINYKESAAKYTFIEDRGSMLVICPEQFMEAMQPFVNWKNQSGRPTTMVSLTDAGGNNDTQIKAYIQNIYDDPNQNLAFILLVGDYSTLKPHAMSGGYSDNWYGMLEGTDYYEEALVGRFSVESVQDVNTHVNKVLYYERDMQDTVTWVHVGMGIGANEGAGSGHMGGEADYVHINYIRDTLLHYTYETVTQQYSGVGGGTSAGAMSADFNAGVSIANYCNHGSQTSWAVGGFSNSNVNALVNDYKWPYIWSVACNNGEFDGTCFGEAWLRATNNTTGVPTGAIGGMFSWISQPWTPPMTGQDEMVDILTEWKSSDLYNHTLGGASLNGSMYILDMHPGDAGNTHNTWILFGDPSLLVRTDNPTNMNATHPSTLLIGMSEMQINVDANYAIATLSYNGEVLASTVLVNGSGTLSFNPISTVGTAQLCVIGYNRVTYMSDIEFIPAEGAYLTVTSHTPSQMPFAQDSNISICLKNVGSDPTSAGSTITLTSEDNVTITNGVATCGVIAANDTVYLENAFTVNVPETAANGDKLHFTVTITCGSDTWSTNFTTIVTKPVITYDGYNWAGQYQAGETLTIVANFKNEGGYRATNAIANISTTSNYITINNTSCEIGTIDPNGIGSCVFSVTVNASCPTTEQIPLNIAMTADNGITAQGTAMLKNTCNVVFTLHDSYGDGWNGASLTVAFSDGSPSQSVTLSSGNSGTQTLEIGSGIDVTISWVHGNYDTECSFEIAYENGDQIYASSGTPTQGVVCTFTCNCAGGAGGNLASVTNLNASVNNDIVTLTWDAPRGFDHYLIRRNGVEIAQTTETTFVDEPLEDDTYTYCVIAVYTEGEATPTCITVTVNVLNVSENESSVSVYPNPAQDMLNISVNGAVNNVEYAIYNYQGQKIMSKNLGTFEGVEQISLEGMAKGIYFLHIVTGTQTSVQKLVVE